MEPRQVPGEIAHTMQLTKDRKTYLPILYIDELSMRQRELVKVNATDEVAKSNFPIHEYSHSIVA